MSTMDSLAPGSTVSSYRLGERIGSTVWRADDTRTGKPVAVKLLARQLPKDPQRRDALVREVRQNAALFHTNLATILEVAVAGDMLLLVMELVDGVPLTKRYTGKPADRAGFFRVAYQAVDVLKLLHAKNVLHANVNGDSLLIAANGQVKLAGLNLSNLLPKKDGAAGTYQQKGSDVRCVSYMAPEQIANQPLTPQTDIWSLGVALYEMATGRLPYTAQAAAEIARKIVDESPASPKASNPDIDTSVLSVMGRCLFKDPFKRHKDAKSMLDEIARTEPQAAAFAAEITRATTSPGASAASSAPQRNVVLLLADVASYEELQATDPAAATKAAARMQQVLGEAAYLFDGQVLDPFAPRLIAEMPSVENALEAARKGEFDFSPDQQADHGKGDPLPVRLLLHAGEVATQDGAVVGDAITKGFEVLAQLPPRQLFLTEEFARRARGKVRLHDVPARAGVKLYEIQPPEPKVELPPEPSTAELKAEEAEEAAALAVAAAARKAKQQRTRLALVAGLVVVILGGSAFVWWSHKPEASSAPVRAGKSSSGPPPATAATPRRVFLPPFSVEGIDGTLAARGNAIRLASIEVLRAFPEIRITDAAAPDVLAVTSTIRPSAAAATATATTATTTSTPPATTSAAVGELVLPDTPAVAVPDVAAGVQAVEAFVTKTLNLPARIATTPEAMNAFGDAVSSNENKKIDIALRATLKADGKFLPAQLMAMRFFASEGKSADALEAAKQVVALDPSNFDAAHTVITASFTSGDLASAFNAYGSILKQDPKNVNALNTIGRYALAAGDTQKFAACLARVKPNEAAIHEPDVLLASGRIDAAADKYYDVKLKAPENVAISLKIGRLSVLRHGVQIAEDELKNLQTRDPQYSAHVLQAYLFAQNGNRSAAMTEMATAKNASAPGDEYYTYLAEVSALAGDPKGTVDALESAANRKEPTAAYVMSNPLFAFLQSDPRFNKVREKMTLGQGEIRAALGAVTF
jgi:tetratricopeptide (TPR) repeat protein/class 3 adenylate cyclase